MSFFLLLNTKGDILKNDGNQQLTVAIEYFFHGSQWLGMKQLDDE